MRISPTYPYPPRHPAGDPAPRATPPSVHAPGRARLSLLLTPALLLPALVLAGCGGGADGAWEGTVRDSAGVEIVASTGGAWGAEEGWTVTQDMAVGAAEGEPEYQFGQIAGIDVDSEGRLYVLDQQAQEIRVFGPSGEFLNRVGKAGAGPGELSRAAGPVFVGPGDTLAVPDVLLQRVTRYTPAGELAGSYPLPMNEGISVKWMEAPNEDLVQQAMIMALPNQPAVEAKNLLLRRSPAGEIRDTVMELPIGKTVDLSGGGPRIRLFEAEPTWAVGPDGRFYFGNNSRYRLEEYSPDGRLVRVIEKAAERRPVTEGDQAEFRRILMDLWKRQGIPPEQMSQLEQAVSFAEHYPAYANVLGGPDGTLWVQAIQTPEEVQAQGGSFNIQDVGSARWEVFDDRGRLLGQVTMPPRFTPLMFLGEDLYGVLRDDMDVQYAARMHVERPTTGPLDG